MDMVLVKEESNVRPEVNVEEFEKYINELPVIPTVASRIMSIAEDNLDVSFKEIEDIISVDPLLTVKILKIANSALYARQSEIKSLQMAITLLGFRNIKSLVILLTASKFSRELKNRKLLNKFWKHSIATAFLSRDICLRQKDKKNADSAFIAGLLHDIGQVALFQKYPEDYSEILAVGAKSEPIEKIEYSLFGTDHRVLGGYLLEKWNFPEMYRDTALEHGDINVQSIYKKFINTVSLADLLTEKIGFGEGWVSDSSPIIVLLKSQDMDEEDLVFFQNEYPGILERDELFLECQDLFLK